MGAHHRQDAGTGPDRIPAAIRQGYEIREWRHASAILSSDFPEEWADILATLGAFRLRREWLEVGGGQKSQVSAALDGALYARGWVEKAFDVAITVDGVSHPSPTHKVDCVKGRVALEIEWNNKDPFYDRDLNNFRLLHQLGVISVGVIVTRSDELQKIFKGLGRGASSGQSTTHMSKLLPRIEGGGAGGCPLLVFGIGSGLYVDEDGVIPAAEGSLL